MSVLHLHIHSYCSVAARLTDVLLAEISEISSCVCFDRRTRRTKLYLI